MCGVVCCVLCVCGLACCDSTVLAPHFHPSLLSAKYGSKHHNRNNRIVAFKYADFKFHQKSGKPLKVTVHRSYNVDVKPVGLHFSVDRSFDSLWIVEYAEPVVLDFDGKASKQQGQTKYGVGEASDTSRVKRKSKRSASTKQPRTRRLSSQASRPRTSDEAMEKPAAEEAIVSLGVSSSHCYADFQQCGWAVRQDLDPRDGLPDAATTNSVDGAATLIPDAAMFVGEGVRGFAIASQLARSYAIIQRCTFEPGYSCRMEFHRFDDLELSNGGEIVQLAGGRNFNLKLLNPGLPADDTTKASGGDTSTPAETPKDRKSQDAKARGKPGIKRRARRKKGSGKRKKVTKASKAAERRKRKKSKKKPETDVQARNLGDAGTMASAIRLPAGATGLAYRESVTENFLMFLFSSAAQPNVDVVLETGAEMEDSVHLMWLPAIASLPPEVQQNILYVKYKLL